MERIQGTFRGVGNGEFKFHLFDWNMSICCVLYKIQRDSSEEINHI